MRGIIIAILVGISTSMSGQTGINWKDPASIAPKSYGNQWPRMVLDRKNNPVVIWHSMANKSVYISRWNGTSFTTPVKISPEWLKAAGASWMGPEIAAKGDTLYVVMKREPEAEDTNHIYIVRSVDGGASFSAPAQVDFIADSLSRLPVVTIDSKGHPVVGFMKFNSEFLDPQWVVTRSEDYGNTFSSDVIASGWSGGEACDCCPGSMVSTGDRITMLYRDNLNNLRDMWAGISNTSGRTFSQGTAIETGKWMIMSCPSSGPDGVEAGDTLYSVYMSGSGGTELVYLSKYSLTAAELSSPQPLTGKFDGLFMQDMPRIARNENSVAVAWKQVVNGSNQVAVRFAQDIRQGLAPGYDMISSSSVMNTDLALADGKIFLVWQDNITGTVQFRQGTYSPSGINNKAGSGRFILYPNPVKNIFTVQAEAFTGPVELTVTDMLGRVTYKDVLQDIRHGITVDAAGWKPGIYFVSARSGSMNHSVKISKLE